MQNLFTAPEHLEDELVEVLAGNQQMRVERLVSRGHASPPGFWYDQEQHEWVTLLAGAARLEFDNGESCELAPGDHLLIPAHRRHRVAWTTPHTDSVWLAVFYGTE